MTDPDALICNRCGQEIEPGTLVEFDNLPEDARIVSLEDAGVHHQACPDPGLL